MKELDQLKKYKQLLDDGAITEEEFQDIKQRVLGLKTDAEKEEEQQAVRDEAMAEVEAMRQQKAEAQRLAQEQEERERKAKEEAEYQAELERKQKENEINAQRAYAEEKAREAARLEAAAEQKKVESQQRKEAAVSGVTNVLGWILSVILFLTFLLFFVLYTSEQKNSVGFYVISQIIMLLQVFALNPLTNKLIPSVPFLSWVKKHRFIFSVILFGVWIIALVIFAIASA